MDKIIKELFNDAIERLENKASFSIRKNYNIIIDLDDNPLVEKFVLEFENDEKGGKRLINAKYIYQHILDNIQYDRIDEIEIPLKDGQRIFDTCFYNIRKELFEN